MIRSNRYPFTVDDPCLVLGNGLNPWPHDCRNTTSCLNEGMSEPTQCSDGLVSNPNGVCVQYGHNTACSTGECYIISRKMSSYRDDTLSRLICLIIHFI